MNSFEQMFRHVKDLIHKNDITEPAYLNMIVTNGLFIVGTRYVSDPTYEPLTLYHTEGSRYSCENGICKMLTPEEQDQAVLIVSEKLTDTESDWKMIPKNHFIVVDDALKVYTKPIQA